MKKDILENYMLRVTLQQFEQPQICTNVNMKNVCFKLNDNIHQTVSRHFVCIASIGGSVISSNIIVDEENRNLKCKQDFYFPRNTGDFDIQVSLYALTVQNKKVHIFYRISS